MSYAGPIQVYYGGCEHDTVCICRCSAVAAGHPPLSIYISFPQGAQQQTHHTPLLWSIDVMDKQTVHIRPLQRPYRDPAPDAMQTAYANSVSRTDNTSKLKGFLQFATSLITTGTYMSHVQ